jgi:valyl-tRNA synthetase
VEEALIDERAEAAGDVVVEIATAVRRYKTENQLRMGAELARLQVAVQDIVLRQALDDAVADIRSVTRAQRVEIVEQVDTDLTIIEDTGTMTVALVREESTSQPTN